MGKLTVQNKKYREKVLGNIKDYYNHGIVSKAVRDMPLDKKAYDKATRFYEPEVEERVKNTYKKFQIARYRDKEHFMEVKSQYQMSEVQLEALWIEYEHRDKLIYSGQYEKLRLQMFRENYVTGMERLGMSKKDIAKFKSLTDEQLDELIMYPMVQKDKPNRSYLPELGLFNYNDSEQSSRVHEELEEAYDYLGIENEMFTKHKNDTLLWTKPNRKGESHRYIRGVGSETGKNAYLIEQIIEYQKDK